ncbi:TadE/TadG family type IV pilus assembly protein [Pseudoduganella rivuli]|nr:TadE/TadG family type IV pilus assembly protein [Pseudoduganella rivuli]
MRPIDRKRRTGALAVEYALVLPVFLLFVFLLLETARAVYLWNTVQEVTRRAARAAAVTDFSCPAAMNTVRRHAIFRDSDGVLLLSGGITQDHVVIDYLWQDDTGQLQPLAAAALAADPAQNRINCMASPGGGNCIQFVRVRICSPDGCAPVPYLPMLSWLPLPGMTVPTAATVVRAESLGYRTSAKPCS